MVITSAGDLITMHEGMRLHVYDDATGKLIIPGYTVEGHPTIGIGRSLDVRGISATEMTALFKSDLAAAEADALEAAGPIAWNKMNEARRAVLMDMAVQLGRAGLEKFVEMIDALQLGEWDIAAQHLRESSLANEAPERTTENATIIASGQWPGAAS